MDTITMYGVKFTDFNGYYRGMYEGRSVFLHRLVYEMEIGPIPFGFQVHHIDGNRSNNSRENLVALSTADHAKMHPPSEEMLVRMRANLDACRDKASEWHRSEEGRKWHRAHAKVVASNISYSDYTCKRCKKVFNAKVSGPNHDFCSNACRAANRRDKGADDVSRDCSICGKSFKVNKYTSQHVCSKKCAGVVRSSANEEKRKNGGLRYKK